jgi:hypothetical protein
LFTKYASWYDIANEIVGRGKHLPQLVIRFGMAIIYPFKFFGVVLDLWNIYQTAAGGIVLAATGGGVGSTKLPWWYATLLGIGIFLVSVVGIALLFFKRRGEGRYAKLPNILRDMNAIMAGEASRQAKRFKRNPRTLDKFETFITRWTRATEKEKRLLLRERPLRATKEQQLGSKWYGNMRASVPEIISDLPDICKETDIGLDTLENKSLRYALLSGQLYHLTPLPSQFGKDVDRYLRLSLIEHTWDMIQRGAKDTTLKIFSSDVTISNLQISRILKILVTRQLEVVGDQVSIFLKESRNNNRSK